MPAEIIVVSGLPRSGTSLMMQMLERGGFEVVTDRIREADTDNPRGYYEFERVKKIRSDRAWLPDARGKAVKMISQLLYDLPDTEQYRVIFMDRDFDEMLRSQEKMLHRLGRAAAPPDQMKANYQLHLDRLFRWLANQSNIRVLRVSYNDVVQQPLDAARRVTEFLGREADYSAMASAVDPSLYRNQAARRAPAASTVKVPAGP